MTKAVIDWELIERDYRAGILSVREIAASQGITHGAINKRAKRDKWSRDLSEKIQARAEQLVSRAAVSTAVSSERLATDRLVIEANAERVAAIRSEHRGGIQRARTLALAMLAELEVETGSIALFAQLGELLAAPDEKGMDKLNELYQRVIALPSRVDSMKKLSETLKVLVGLERQAYGIADAETDKPKTATLIISHDDANL
jgi:hypothetical protein